MQRTAERDVHLLKAAAYSEQRHAALNADLNQLQRQRVTPHVVGLVARMRLGAEVRRVNVRARARQQNAVDQIEQFIDGGELRRAGEHDWHGAGDICQRVEISLADALGGKSVIGQVQAANHADDGPLHRLVLTSLPANRRRRLRAARAPRRESAVVWQS